MELDSERLDRLHHTPANSRRLEQAYTVYLLKREDELSFDAIAARLRMSKGKVFYLYWAMHHALDYRVFCGGGDADELVWAFGFFFAARNRLGKDISPENQEGLFARLRQHAGKPPKDVLVGLQQH